MKEFDLKKYLAENKLLDEVRYLEGKAVTQDELHNIIGKKMEEQGYQRAGFMGTSIPDDEGSYRDYYKEVRDEDGNLYYLNISVLVSSTIETDYHGEITFELRVARDKKGLKALFSREKREMIKSLATNKDITRGINFDGSYNKIRKAVLLRTPSTIKSLEDKALRKINRAADPLNLEEELGKYQDYSSDEEYEKIEAIIKAIKDLGDTLSKNGKIDLASALEPIATTLKYRGGYY